MLLQQSLLHWTQTNTGHWRIETKDIDCDKTSLASHYSPQRQTSLLFCLRKGARGLPTCDSFRFKDIWVPVVLSVLEQHPHTSWRHQDIVHVSQSPTLLYEAILMLKLKNCKHFCSDINDLGAVVRLGRPKKPHWTIHTPCVNSNYQQTWLYYNKFGFCNFSTVLPQILSSLSPHSIAQLDKISHRCLTVILKHEKQH